MDTSSSDLAARLLEQRDWLRELAAQLVRAGEGDDLVQETYLAALAHPQRELVEPRSWLAAIARNLARGLRRTRGRRDRRERLSARPEALPSTGELVERVDTEQRLTRELLALREPYRTTLLLRFHEGLAAEAIAVRQGISAGTVRWRTNLGLAELRAKLEPAYGGREAWSLALAELQHAGREGLRRGVWLGGGALAAKWAAVAVVALLAGWGVLALSRGRTAGGMETPAARPELVSLHEEDAVSPDEGDPVPGVPREAVLALSWSDPGFARVRILDSDGRALPAARDELREAGASAREARTDEHGWLGLESRALPIEVAIERERSFVHRQALALHAGEQELRLPGERVLAGRLLVSGAPPERPLRVDLYRPRAFTGARDTDSLGLFERANASTRTDANGDFEFRALDERDYDLVLPRGHAEQGTLPFGGPDQRRVVSVRPGRGQVFELERYPRVHGRVLGADGNPCEAIVACRVTWTNGSNMDTGARADAAGEFEMFFERAWRALSLEVCGSPGRIGCVTRAFSAEEAPSGELGDIVLAAGRTIRLRVLDPDGRPVAGAFTDTGSSPTDAMGETTLVGLNAEWIDVAAYGHLAKRVDLPPEEHQDLEVVLDPGPELTIRVTDSRGTPVPFAGIGFQAGGALFDCEGGTTQRSIWRHGAEHAGRFSSGKQRRGGGIESAFECDGEGRLKLGGVLPGQGAELRACAGNVAAEVHWLEPLGIGEKRELELRLDVRLTSFEGRVLDEEGEPVPGARLGSISSDTLGRFRAMLALNGPTRMRVEKDGYLPLEFGFSAEDETPLELRLELGRHVFVSVLDAAGRHVDGGAVAFRPIGRESWQEMRAIGVGRFETSALERGLLYEFELRLAGKTQRIEHDAGDQELVFTVERPGEVELSWKIETSESWLYWLDLRLVPVNGTASESERGHGTAATSGVQRFLAVPEGRYEAVLTFRSGDTEVDLCRRPLAVRPGETARVGLLARR